MWMRLLSVRGRWLVCPVSWRGGTFARICILCWARKSLLDCGDFMRCVWRMGWRRVVGGNGLEDSGGRGVCDERGLNSWEFSYGKFRSGFLGIRLREGVMVAVRTHC